MKPQYIFSKSPKGVKNGRALCACDISQVSKKHAISGMFVKTSHAKVTTFTAVLQHVVFHVIHKIDWSMMCCNEIIYELSEKLRMFFQSSYCLTFNFFHSIRIVLDHSKFVNFKWKIEANYCFNKSLFIQVRRFLLPRPNSQNKTNIKIKIMIISRNNNNKSKSSTLPKTWISYISTINIGTALTRINTQLPAPPPHCCADTSSSTTKK